ncbi:MAG: endolytic transglycosylase MltG [Mariprofundus sp.]|nr:endolytic transglycosylase MltG [Mariprofundus sp.]
MSRLWLWLLLAVLSALGGVAGWLYMQTEARHAPAQAVQIMIPHGASTIKIARLLQQQDVITSKYVFRLLMRFEAAPSSLRSGLYSFEQPARMSQIIKRLQRGDVMRFKVTVPEGLRTDEVLSLLARKTATKLADWQRALKTLLPNDDEGRLLPETYQYNKPIQIKRMLNAMLQAQDKIMAQLATDAAEQQRLRIMASIIEKETRLEKERTWVAAVIRNRLMRGMPLQMDPTVIYGLWKRDGHFSGNIRKKDLSTNTPWNTYTNRGLPPTPIGNPGAASLRAAAAPADVTYLFFVADGTGGHQFATTLAGHNANVARWLKIERKKKRAK